MLFQIFNRVLILCLAASAAVAEEPTVETTPLKAGLYLMQGRGGNVIASLGEDGVLLVDDDYKQYQPAYLEALGELGMDGVRFVVNTHWHGDHSGGNELWGKSGSVILGHENVRERMSTLQEMKRFNRTVDPSPQVALPLVTFDDSLAMHLNGETIEVQHYPLGHTDGDSVVYFVEPNVVHMGDHYFKDRFPFVDLDSGGTVGGYIRNVNAVLSRVDENTVIVPGHGSLANRGDLVRYYRMLVKTRDEVQAMLDEGMDLEAIQEKGLDPKWESWGTGFIDEKSWISFIVSSPR